MRTQRKLTGMVAGTLRASARRGEPHMTVRQLVRKLNDSPVRIERSLAWLESQGAVERITRSRWRAS